MTFSQISIKELPAWVKVLKVCPEIETKNDMLNELTLIDDLLVLQKSKSLLNRKKSLKAMLEARIALFLGLKTQNLNKK